jgi:hypothetical protein
MRLQLPDLCHSHTKDFGLLTLNKTVFDHGLCESASACEQPV